MGPREQAQHVPLVVAVGDACFQPGGQRPQFGDRFGSVAGLAGDFGQPDRGFAELKHGAVIAVGRVGDAENVRRDM